MSTKVHNAKLTIWINGQEVKNNIASIKAEYRKLNNELNRTTIGTDEYNKKAAEIKKVDAIIDNHKKHISGVSKAWSLVKTEMLTITTGVAGAMAIQAVIQKALAFIPNLVNGNAKLADSYADIMKTTGLTRVQTEELNKSFKNLNTRTPREELRKLAVEAGKQGRKSLAEIKEFVNEANIVTVGLGEDLGEGAVSAISKAAQNFNVSMLQIGSAINEVASNSNAKEGFLVDFLSRVAPNAKAVGILAQQVIGYAAVLDEAGLQAEMSGTAMSDFFVEFDKQTEKFGKVAGMTTGELTKLKEELGNNEAFLIFLENLKKANPKQEDFLKALEKIGITGARGSAVFLTLSQKIDQVRERQELSNKALLEGTSLTKEYNTKNENLAGTLEKLSQWMGSKFQNSGLVSFFEKMANAAWDYVKVPLSESMMEEKKQANLLVQSIVSVNDNNRLRRVLIDELISQFPQYYSNIDKEKTTNTELLAVLRDINIEYDNKIKMQALSERKEKILREAVDLKSEELELQMSIIELRNKYADSLTDYQKREGAPLEEIVQGLLGAGKFFGNSLSEVETWYNRLLEIRKEIAANENEHTKLLLMINDEKRKLDDTNPTSPKFMLPGSKNKVDDKGGSGNALTEEEIAKRKKANEEYLKLKKELVDKSRELNQLMIQDELQTQIEAENNRYEAAVEEIELKRDTAIQKAKEAGLGLDEEKRLLFIANHDLFKIESIHKDKLVDLKAKHHKKLLEEDIKAAADKKRWEESEKDAKLKNDFNKAENEGNLQGQLDAEFAILENDFMRQLETITGQEEAIILLKEEYKRKQDELDEKYRNKKEERENEENENLRKKIEEKIEIVSLYYNAAMGLDQLVRTLEDNRMSELENQYNAEVAALNERKEKELISEEEYNKKKNKLDRDLNRKKQEIERKRAIREKASAIVEIAINTAVQASKYLGNPILLGAVIAAGALQAAAVAAQEIPPLDQFFEGGSTEVKGKKDGKKYKPKWVGSHTGYLPNGVGILTNERGNEFVLPDHVVKNYPDFMRIAEALTYNKNISSGFSPGTKSTPEVNYSSNSTAASTTVNIDMNEMLLELREIKEYLSDPNNRKAHISHDLLKEYDDNLAIIQSLAKTG